MNHSFSTLLEQSKQAVKYWWLLLIVGIALFILGMIVFFYPAQSYLELALIFGFFILFSGIFQIILAATNKHYITGRGWMLSSGIIETILGIILTMNTSLSMTTMPLFLAFWLMFRGFTTIGLSGDMSTMNVPGATWNLLSGILLLLVSLWILFQPLVLGTSAVIWWVGISLLLAGISTFLFAIQLKSAHKHIK